MAVDSTSIIDKDDVKLLMNIDSDDVSRDSIIEQYCDNVTSLLEVFCDRQFKAREYTEYYDGDGSDTFYTDQYPINSITSIWDDTTRTFDSTSSLDSTDYIYYSKEGKVLLVSALGSGFYGGFSKGNQNIKIIYNSGYITIPNMLKMIAIEIVVKKIQTMETRRIGATSITNHGDTITLNLSDILPEHKNLLNQEYRKRSLGR